MTKKETTLLLPIRRINLTLPVVQTDSYEIYDTTATSSSRQLTNGRPMTRRKPLIEAYRRNAQLPSRTRADQRGKHVTGPVLINFIVDMPAITRESSSTVADNISNALINSGYSEQTLRAVPKMIKRNKKRSSKEELDQSCSTSEDRLLYESVESFDDLNIHKPKTTNWQNIHHPQLSSSKVFQSKRIYRRSWELAGFQLRTFPISSFEARSKELSTSSNEHLHNRIEQLTKQHYPSIQQLRHSHPCPELLTNRMHLHREEKRDFMPLLPRKSLYPTVEQ